LLKIKTGQFPDPRGSKTKGMSTGSLFRRRGVLEKGSVNLRRGTSESIMESTAGTLKDSNESDLFQSGDRS